MYSVLRKNFNNLKQEPNQNFIKMEYILNNNHKFDSFIFGSSRVGKINPQFIPFDNYYNMTYSEGLPLEHLANIKLLLKNGIEIKNIMLGFDDFSYEVKPEKHLNELLRKPHYLTTINNENPINYYSSYFMKMISPSDISIFIKEYILNMKTNIKVNKYDIYETGLLIVPEYIEKYIEENKIKHINDPKFLKSTHYSGNRIKETIQEIKEIISLSTEYNFNLIFFINPIHHTTYLDTNFENFQLFKKELSKVTEFYDFSGLNNITINNYFYYETSHYRTIVGNMIIDTIFNNSKNFGILVSKENIEEHLENLREQIKDYN